MPPLELAKKTNLCPPNDRRQAPGENLTTLKKLSNLARLHGTTSNPCHHLGGQRKPIFARPMIVAKHRVKI